MTDAELWVLVNQAAFLHERLAGDWLAADRPANQQAAQARLARWAQLAAGGDWPRFVRRLAWDGIDPASAHLLLCDGSLADQSRLPDWTEMLREALDQPLSPSGGSGAAAFVQPIVAAALARLAHTSAEQLAWLSTRACQHLTDHLVERLVALAWPTLERETTSHPSGVARLLAALPNLPVESAPPDLRAICQAYPVLARQLATTAAQWVETIAEFLVRLAADWEGLARKTGLAVPLAAGCVVGLQPGLSDAHRSGRTVWRVDLSGGVSVAYKPKDIAPDRAWNDLLVWCNAHGLTPALRPLWTLLGTNYGWMEWVADDKGPDPAESQLYYRRAGLLLGLLHLLHAADAHGENLISQAAHPLLIDGEMLRYPQIAGQEADDPLDVMRTGLLPRWIVGEAGSSEIGGLPAASASPFREEIAAGYAALCSFVAAHWNTLHAAGGPLAAFQRSLVRIAPRPTAAYLRLLEHLRQPAFLRRGIDFSIEADRLARTYTSDPDKERLSHLLKEEHAALNQGDVPIFVLASGSERAELPFVWPPLALPTPIAQAQQLRLIRESLDDSAWFAAPNDAPQPFLRHALRLGELLAEQAVPLEGGGVGWVALQFQPKAGLHQHALIGDDLYAGRAGVALFLAGLYVATSDERWRTLALSALQPAGRSADAGGRFYVLAQLSAWLAAPELLAQTQFLVDRRGRLQHRSLGPWLKPRATGIRPLRGLLHGVVVRKKPAEAGVPCSPALQGRAASSGVGSPRRWALLRPSPRALTPRRTRSRFASSILEGRASVGEAGLRRLRKPAQAGFAAVAEGFSPTAARFASSIATTALIDSPSAWGVLDGQAGLLLGLLALADRATATSERSRLLERAVACGERLLAEATGWLHPSGGLGGFAHGAAGIGYAFARLHAASGDRHFLEGARQAWAFQATLYDAAHGNWQDRRGKTPVYLDNWCNGAAGIGLAAAGCIETLPELVEVVEQVAARLSATASAPFLDTLCCGGFGQIDSLLEMGHLLNRPAWVAQAQNQARQVLEQASVTGSFHLYDDLPAQHFNPVFFRGAAGIGYTLLRLAAVSGEIEQTIPCVLNWSME